MKKGLCLFLSILLIAVSFCSCSMIKDDAVLDEYTYVDEQGETHEYATDPQGEIVTQKGGEKETTSSTKKNDSADSLGLDNYAFYATDTNGENVTNKDGSLVTTQVDWEGIMNEMTNTTTTKKGQTGTQNANPAPDFNGALEGSDKDDLLEEGDKTSKTNLKEKYIDPVVKTGKYTLSATVVAQDIKMPMTMCLNGKDYSASLTMSMGALKISARVFSKNGKYYAVIPMFGMYSEMNEETSEDISNPSGDLTSSATYVKSTKVKDGSVTYTCEEFKTKDGKTIKYYFNEKNEWKRWEVISGSAISVFEISSFKGTVDKSMFEIPKGLKKVDFDKLAG